MRRRGWRGVCAGMAVPMSVGTVVRFVWGRGSAVAVGMGTREALLKAVVFAGTERADIEVSAGLGPGTGVQGPGVYLAPQTAGGVQRAAARAARAHSRSVFGRHGLAPP